MLAVGGKAIQRSFSSKGSGERRRMVAAFEAERGDVDELLFIYEANGRTRRLAFVDRAWNVRQDG